MRLVVGLLVGWLACAGRVTAQDLASQEPMPNGPGRETVEMVCGVCHEIGTAVGTRRPGAEWRQLIDAMINRGAIGTDEEFASVFAYLSTYFGLVNVNKAPAEEIARVLELPPSVAEAVVRHRTESGEFKTLDDLKQVPGVDAKALEERKLRVAFK